MKKINMLSAHEIEQIHDAAQIIRNNMKQHLTIKDIAERAMLTEKKLKTGFKQVYGMGVHAYLRHVRLEKVRAMLVDNRPQKLIIRVTGFKSESSLSKTFKKVIGVTPTEWKNNGAHLDTAM